VHAAEGEESREELGTATTTAAGSKVAANE